MCLSLDQNVRPYRHGKETQGKNTSPHRTRSRGHSHAEGVLWPYLRERGHPHGTADGSARDAKDDSLLPCPKEGVRLSSHPIEWGGRKVALIALRGECRSQADRLDLFAEYLFVVYTS